MKVHNGQLLNILTLNRTNLSELTDKYMFICLVLDELTFRKYYEKEDEVSIGFLRKRISKKMSLSLYHKPIALLEFWLLEVQVMGLITLSKHKEDGKEIIMTKLTRQGEEAYQKQTYHQIYANLIAAKLSRWLAILAIFVSLIALIVSLVNR